MFSISESLFCTRLIFFKSRVLFLLKSEFYPVTFIIKIRLWSCLAVLFYVLYTSLLLLFFFLEKNLCFLNFFFTLSTLEGIYGLLSVKQAQTFKITLADFSFPNISLTWFFSNSAWLSTLIRFAKCLPKLLLTLCQPEVFLHRPD